MLLLDVIIRYPTITLLFLAALLIVRDAWQLPAARYGALVSITVGAMLMATPYPGLELPYFLHVVFRFIDVPSIAFIWWFGRSLFEDDFHLGWPEWIGFIAVVIPTIGYRLTELELAVFDLRIIIAAGVTASTVLMGHLIYVTISGRQDDVIESRRRMRFYFVLALGFATLSIIGSERLLFPEYDIQLSIVRAAIVFPMALWGTLWLTRLDGEKLTFQPLKAIAIESPKLDPRDKNLHLQLLNEMQQQQAYRESGLTIRVLAARLKVPEHRLRALINQGMGYRNFSGFVNDYRIEAIKQAMQKPENARTPILTLALNEGFNSLAPFNRAFRAITGQTPTEYRDNLYRKANQN